MSGNSKPVRSRRVPAVAAVAAAVVAALAVLQPDFAGLLSDSEAEAQVRRPSRSSQLQKLKKLAKQEPPVTVPKRAVRITPVNPSTLAQVKRSARQIDSIVDAAHKRHNVTPNEKTSDAEFIRRVYLDVTGRIPTYQHVNSFLNSRDPEKRAKLIDNLLNSKDYASNFYNFWGDVLRLTDRLNNQVNAKPFQEWIKVALETNMPYDQFVHEMLTASGKVWDNPATGYYLRDTGMPIDNMNNTIRIFLGTQIGCAQCHNHPFDRWTQMEFYKIAAFTYGTQTRTNLRDKERFGDRNPVNDLRAQLVEMNPDDPFANRYRRWWSGNSFEVWDQPTRKLTLPHDYAYSDAKPRSAVEPATLMGPQADLKGSPTPRVAFARWLTSPDNPRFAKTISNRLWRKVFGIGLIEPVDDMKDDTVASIPELMDFLEKEMVRVKFDMKEYLRIILNSETYQRQAVTDDIDFAEPYYFQGPLLRRMTAEQAWDSFITLATFKPEDFQPEPARIESELLNIDLATVTAEEIMQRREKLQEAQSRKIRDAREKDRRYKGLLLVRASELPLPSPPAHFLRQFGQSDRELIEASSVDGSVPQVLQMFNGEVTHMLLAPESLMYYNVSRRTTPEQRVDVIFKSILSREPTKEEMEIALDEIRSHGLSGYGNVIWALVNTREFLFVQ